MAVQKHAAASSSRSAKRLEYEYGKGHLRVAFLFSERLQANAFPPVSPLMQGLNVSGNFAQVVVELVIAAFEFADDRLGNRLLVKIKMRNWRDVVIGSMIEVDRRGMGQS